MGATPTVGEVAITVSGICKVFPGTRALDHVSLEIHRGEVHGLCGGNGSGKSTLIKILCGVYPGDEGTVRFGGRNLDVTAISAKTMHDLGLRVVHQDLAVFPHLSVAENLCLGASYPLRRTGGIDWSALRKRTRGLIERFEIDRKSVV